MGWKVVCVLFQRPAGAVCPKELFRPRDSSVVALIIRKGKNGHKSSAQPEGNQEGRDYSFVGHLPDLTLCKLVLGLILSRTVHFAIFFVL